MGLTKAADSTPHDETDPGRPGIPMDGYDRYLLPDPTGEREGVVPWTRSSTVKGRVQNSEALKAYNEKMLAKGLAISPDLEALIAATPLSAPGAHDTLMEAIEQAKVRGGARVAANLGSALHAFTESLDKGEPLEDVLERVPDRLKPDVQAYADMLVRYGLEPVPELVERVVVNRKLQTGLTWDGKPGTRKNAAAGAAARFDRMYRWTDPEGNVWLIPGDLKTGKNAVAYGSLETCCQIATAVNADAMWNEDRNEYEPMPDVRRDIGLLIHLPVGTGRCEPEELDVAFGWEVAQLAVKLMLVDKAKDHCHRPFSARVLDAMPAPAEPDVFDRIAEQDAAPGLELEATAPVADVHQERADADGVTRAEGKNRNMAEKYGTPEPAPAATGDTRTLDELLEADELDVAAVEAAAKAEAEARELEPLARDVGASRGCSQCGRTGHRANSKKCLSVRDPEVRARKAIGIVELRQGPMTGRPSAGGPIAYTPEPEATVPVPDGVIACGPGGAVTELTPGDAAVVQAFADQLAQGETYEDVVRRERATCSHSGGYSKNEDGVWVCAACGQESPQAAEARRAREAMDNPGPSTPGDVGTEPSEPAGPETVPAPAEEPDPFAAPEEVKDPAVHLMRMVQAAENRETLQVLRQTGLREGVWSKEHTAAGLERLRQLTS